METIKFFFAEVMMSESVTFDSPAQDIGYFIFMDRDERTVLYTRGILDDVISGYLVLTTRKLFFFFWSNINRDKKFIASYPYIISAEMKSGTFFSTLTVSSKKETFTISRIKRSKAAAFLEKLDEIISNNK
jgi:hypothetical protein